MSKKKAKDTDDKEKFTGSPACKELKKLIVIILTGKKEKDEAS